MRTCFLVFVSSSILLAGFVGPSGAIAMQPRMVNYTLLRCQLALNISEDILFPNFFNKSGPSLLGFDSNGETMSSSSFACLVFFFPVHELNTLEQTTKYLQLPVGRVWRDSARRRRCKVSNRPHISKYYRWTQYGDDCSSHASSIFYPDCNDRRSNKNIVRTICAQQHLRHYSEGSSGIIFKQGYRSVCCGVIIRHAYYYHRQYQNATAICQRLLPA